MKVIIFTEAGTQYGYGHLMRCLALAQGFKERLLDVIFIIRGDGDYSEILADYKYKQIEWQGSIGIKGFSNKNDIAIVDSYYIDEKLCSKIYEKFKKVLFFDDFQRINYPGGVVLNSVIGAEKLNYSEIDGVKYLLGVKFQPLRRDFWDVPKYIVGEDINNIMITFGGSDITNKTSGYIKKVKKLYPEAKVTVIIGKGFINKDSVLKQKDNNIKFLYSPNAKTMLETMLKSDLAISAAGQTISELARVGVPTIGIKVAENQKNNIKYWKESGFLLSEDILKKGIPQIKREICSIKGRALIDGQGVKNIMSSLLC